MPVINEVIVLPRCCFGFPCCSIPFPASYVKGHTSLSLWQLLFLSCKHEVVVEPVWRLYPSSSRSGKKSLFVTESDRVWLVLKRVWILGLLVVTCSRSEVYEAVDRVAAKQGKVVWKDHKETRYCVNQLKTKWKATQPMVKWWREIQ